VNAVRFAGQFHDGGAVDDAIEECHGQMIVVQVFGPFFEVDIRHQGGAGAITACINDLVPQAGCVGTQAAFNLVEAKFINDEQVVACVEAYALVDGLVGQRGGEVFD
jgi:hypothetical protein